jgi:3-oxoacyl-[acyl-carrier protein] reductase
MRNVIVTGGSRGLGLEIAATLAAEGYRVIAVARSETDQLRAAISLAETRGSGGLCLRPFDLANTGGIAGFVSALRKEFGPIYGLINNAGMGTPGMLTLMPEQQIEALVTLNILSPVILTKHVLRSMMLERAGRIINMSSIVATTGYSGLSVYSTTKASLLGFTRSLAREVGPLGITVNAIAPGFVDTDMTKDLHAGERERIARRSALNRLADAGDVASAVAFLLTEKARNITATTITVDAGNTA